MDFYGLMSQEVKKFPIIFLRTKRITELSSLSVLLAMNSETEDCLSNSNDACLLCGSDKCLIFNINKICIIILT